MLYIWFFSLCGASNRTDKSRLFPSCLPQYKQTCSFTRQPSLTTRVGISKPMSWGRIHGEGGGRWACVCMACVWRRVCELAKSADSNLGVLHVKHLSRLANNHTSSLQTMFLLSSVKIKSKLISVKNCLWNILNNNVEEVLKWRSLATRHIISQELTDSDWISYWFGSTSAHSEFLITHKPSPCRLNLVTTPQRIMTSAWPSQTLLPTQTPPGPHEGSGDT